MASSNFLIRANKELAEASPAEVLQWAAHTFPGSLTLATALGPEAQILTHMIAHQHLPIDIFTLDTGRHFEETHRLLDLTRNRYQVPIRVYFPDPADVERVVNESGPYAFRESVEARKQCCHIRKVKPLFRALEGKEAWLTGLRREQSPTRGGVKVIEWDEAHGLYKINPLWLWDEDQVWGFIRKNEVPYNELHDHNYPSIGCAPCTRATEAGEDIRAGRWWWENPETKECGIHLVNGRMQPKRRSAQPALSHAITV